MKRMTAAWLLVVLAGIVGGVCRGADGQVVQREASEYLKRSWGRDQGLPPGERVYAIAQTQDGYLWIGTQYGLARFDGRTFSVFDHINTPALVSDDCRSLAADKEGVLWVSTRTGLIRRVGNTFEDVTPLLGTNFADYAVLRASDGGGVWGGGVGAVFRVQGDKAEIYRQSDSAGGSRAAGEPGNALTVKSEQALGKVLFLDEDAAGVVWVCSASGLWRLDPRAGVFERAEAVDGINGRIAVSTEAAGHGDRWVVYTEYAPSMDRARPKSWLTRLAAGAWPKPPEVQELWPSITWHGRFLVTDDEGSLWLPGAAGGVQRYRRGQREFFEVESQGRKDLVLTAFCDREANIWLGTDYTGLRCWRRRSIMALNSDDGLANNNVWTICQGRDGAMYVGTDGGVTRFGDGEVTTLTGSNGLPHRDVRAVAEDNAGRLWVGTMRNLQMSAQGVGVPVELPGEWFEGKIRALCPGRTGGMWVGTVKGLTWIQDDVRRKYTKQDGLGADEVRAVLEDRRGVVWVGTMGGGLSRFRDGAIVTMTKAEGLTSDNVWSLDEDAEGVIWAGTDDGLNRIEGERITRCTTAEGLPERLVNWVVSDGCGRLWVGHDNGVYALDRKELAELAAARRTTVTAVQYDEADGLPGLESNGQKSYPAACRTREGKLWLPMSRGVAIVEPERAAKTLPAPLPVIEEVRANGRLVYSNRPNGTNGSLAGSGGVLYLPPGGARVLQIDYTANTFSGADKAKFRYRLAGVEDTWIEAGTRRQAYFTDLHPGDYTFEVTACNRQGRWQERRVQLGFQVAPFYYQTWWFYTLCGGVVMGLTWWGIRWRLGVSRRMLELERVNALSEQRRQIARDIHDELGAYLTRIIRLNDRIRNSAEHREKPDAQVEGIAQVAGEAVDNIGEIVWANNPEYDTLEDLVAHLREQAAGFLEGLPIGIHFDFPKIVPERSVSGRFRRHVLMILRESLQNVVKHAEARSVTVRVGLSQNEFALAVEDDGKGLAGGGKGRTGNGLVNMQQRVAELEGELAIEPMAGGGTRVRLRAPLRQR